MAQLVARASGRLDLKGQFAISSYDRIVRERIRRFDISVPLSGTRPRCHRYGHQPGHGAAVGSDPVGTWRVKFFATKSPYPCFAGGIQLAGQGT